MVRESKEKPQTNPLWLFKAVQQLFYGLLGFYFTCRFYF